MEKELIKRIISSIVLFPISIIIIIEGSIFFYISLSIIFVISVYEWHIISKNKLLFYCGIIYSALFVWTVVQLRFISENNYWILIITIIICVLTDIGGYVFGKILKGPKLTIYSPNKTFSGLFGSFILSFLSILILIFFDLLNEVNLINFIFFIIFVSAASQIGDILISYLKRTSNIKDSGKIIPGHGGLLDRIDGMLLAFPVAYLLQLIKFLNF